MNGKMFNYEGMVELTSTRFGSRAVACSDDFFASMDNLLRTEAPLFIPDKYTDRGKWMDGWESRRRRGPGFDWCVIRLGVPGVVHGIVVDTSHFTGNHPESASIEGVLVSGDPPAEELTGWTEILPRSSLQGNSLNRFTIDNHLAYSHLRLNIFPDGGVSRLRVHGEPLPDWWELSRREAPLDLASAALGAKVLFASDMHFGSRHNLIMPDRAQDMRDGWETRRRRGPGHDWCVISLGAEGIIERVEVDTAHFKGNFPESCSLEACRAGSKLTPELAADANWISVLPRVPLLADNQHVFHSQLGAAGPVDHVRFCIYPDGGVSRLRLFGDFSDNGWRQVGVRHFNALPADAARARIQSCCASRQWSLGLVGRRPFSDLASLQSAADEVWKGLTPTDYLEAFAGHPRIGETKPAPAQDQRSASWSSQEQSRAALASDQVRAELAKANQIYQDRFGFIFIVCASGKSAEEILGLLRSRLENDREAEILNAAEQQRQITRLRLEKLFVP